MKTRTLTLLVTTSIIATVSANLPAQDYTCATNADGASLTITSYTGPGGEVIIPQAINGLPVTQIGNAAFAGNRVLTSVVIPDSVTNIASGGWYFSPFPGVGGLYHLNGAFYGCDNLTSATLGNGLIALGDYAFDSCFNLTNVVLGKNLETIGVCAFYSCGITEITIPSSIVSIRGGVNICGLFSEDDVCPRIDEGDVTVFFGSFARCVNLTSVYFEGSPPAVHIAGTGGPEVFNGVAQVTSYYLRGASGWGSTFANRPTALWNLPPTADATATATLVFSSDSLPTEVALDGSRSSDPHNDPLTYAWVWNIGGTQTLLSTGVLASVELPVGIHQLDLIVDDGMATATNSINIAVLSPSSAVQWLIAVVEEAGLAKTRRMVATLTAALASIDQGKAVAAANQLQAFQRQVQVQMNDDALAQQLTAVAQQVIDALESESGRCHGPVRSRPHPHAKPPSPHHGSRPHLHR